MPLLRAPGYVGVPSRRFLCWWWLIYGVCERSRLSGCSGFRYGFREQHHGVPKDTENPHRSTQTSSLPNRLGRYAPSPSRWLTHGGVHASRHHRRRCGGRSREPALGSRGGGWGEDHRGAVRVLQGL